MDLRLSARQRQINLRATRQSNPRTLTLAEQFKTQYPAPKPRLWAMMGHFNSEPFFYTLTPPPLGPFSKWMISYLKTKPVFACTILCLHLWRGPQVLPARMVTGYQGENIIRKRVTTVCINIWPTHGQKSGLKMKVGCVSTPPLWWRQSYRARFRRPI